MEHRIFDASWHLFGNIPGGNYPAVFRSGVRGGSHCPAISYLERHHIICCQFFLEYPDDCRQSENMVHNGVHGSGSPDYH
jgi:hypothetical protein